VVLWPDIPWRDMRMH